MKETFFRTCISSGRSSGSGSPSRQVKVDGDEWRTYVLSLRAQPTVDVDPLRGTGGSAPRFLVLEQPLARVRFPADRARLPDPDFARCLGPVGLGRIQRVARSVR